MLWTTNTRRNEVSSYILPNCSPGTLQDFPARTLRTFWLGYKTQCSSSLHLIYNKLVLCTAKNIYLELAFFLPK